MSGVCPCKMLGHEDGYKGVAMLFVFCVVGQSRYCLGPSLNSFFFFFCLAVMFLWQSLMLDGKRWLSTFLFST